MQDFESVLAVVFLLPTIPFAVRSRVSVSGSPLLCRPAVSGGLLSLLLLLSGQFSAAGAAGRLGPGLASPLPALTEVDEPDSGRQAAIAAAAAAGQPRSRSGHARSAE